MSTVVAIMDRPGWEECTDNIAVADPGRRELRFIPRDLWCEGIGDRINRAFALGGHDLLRRALAEHGIRVDHGLCLQRGAIGHAVRELEVTVPVGERLEFWYPVSPERPIEEGRRRISFEPPAERLAGERIHQWIGARTRVDGRRMPLLEGGDFARIRRQQTLLRRLLEDGFDFGALLSDPGLVSESGPQAREELALIDTGWEFTVLADVRDAVRDGKQVLERQDHEEPGASGPGPAATVVVLAYNSRSRIDTALNSLRAQRFDEPFEVVVVDSGDDGCGDYVASAYPEVRLVRSPERLWPGAARNRGLRAARGECVAFLADDCAAEPDWLRRRVELHRRGFDLVGGAVANGTPRSAIGTAGYLLEYSAVLPSRRILAEQEIPHSLSYSRRILSEGGEFPAEVRTGEDTVFNERLLRAGATLALEPGITMTHDNPTALRDYLHHHYVHGRGMIECARRYGHSSPALPHRDTPVHAAAAMFVRYPALRWARAGRRIARGQKRSVLPYLALSPLIWAGLWATSLGAWSQWRSLPVAAGRHG